MKRDWIVLGIILGIAAIIRLWHLGGLPPGVNRDEASIGYTAYSILKTGKDEYGVYLPLSIKSFGDWKLPLYIYTSIIPISIFGLSDFSVRLVSALAGILTVLWTYFLVVELLKSQIPITNDLQGQKDFIGHCLPAGEAGKLDIGNSKSIALLSAMLLAISPWHIHFSRVASEANLAVLLTVIAVWQLFVSFRKPAAIMGSAILFALTLYTYHGNHVFTPLLILGGIIIFYKDRLRSNIYAIRSLGIFAVLAVFIYATTFLGADKTKFMGTSILSDPAVVHYQIELPRADHGGSNIFAKIVHNRFAYVAKKFIENYLLSFSPDFLFIRGGGNSAHNIPLAGNAYLLEWPFLFVGIYWILKTRQSSGLFILWWLAVAPIASSLTKDAPHSARMLAILPVLQVITAFGMMTLLDFVRRKVKILVTGALILGYLWSLLLYFDAYFVHFPQTNSQDWGVAYQTIARYLSDNDTRFDRIIFNKPERSPYIYLAFYQRLNPEVLQHKITRYPETNEGFSHVAQMGTIEFREPRYPGDLLQKKTLVIDWASDIPMNILSFGSVEKEVKTLGGKPSIVLLSSSSNGVR